ncbi:YihY/virulence factor BrkB family protein [Pontibacillus litoralis]|uniref:YihY/virulence factor BrkB family protein n=1 Tax=Pontibacillus litoralis TaxID=516703 RepID=UPI00055FFBA2|nr:YihY/virulence factor BrkB family protein [Pontibacillus litoralis]
MQTALYFAKELIKEFQKDNVPILAAAQAYYYLLSIVPLLILVLAIVPYFNIDPDRAVQMITNSIPGETGAVFEETIVDLVSVPKEGLLTFGIIGTIWTASSGMTAFIKAANEAYNVEETRSFVKVKALSVLLTLGMIVALGVALLLPVFGEVIIQLINRIISIPDSVMGGLSFARWGISFVVMSTILILLYRFAPNKRLPYKHIFPGACVATVLWLLISLGFSYYISNFGNYSATYGSLGGVIILMVWFFLIGLIFVIGAELNIIYHRLAANK